MKCPFCSYIDTKITNSRTLDTSSAVRRRRECPSCYKRFTTYERVEEVPLLVVKADNRREPFNREKMREGIMRACRKRPVEQEAVEKIVNEIEDELQEYVMEVPSEVIGEKVLEKLFKLDTIAYIRFASVYHKFDDIDTFLEELNRIKEQVTEVPDTSGK